MKKYFKFNRAGFLFTIDAIIGVVVIFALIGAWVFSVQANDNKNMMPYLDKVSYDKAIIGFYNKKPGTGNLQNADFGVCNSYYYFKNGTINEEKFCEKNE